MNTGRQERIENCLKKAFAPTFLEVIDEGHLHIGHAGAATGLGHFKIIIASKVFAHKSSLEIHRLIYQALGDLMHTDIHALKIEIKH